MGIRRTAARLWRRVNPRGPYAARSGKPSPTAGSGLRHATIDLVVTAWAYSFAAMAIVAYGMTFGPSAALVVLRALLDGENNHDD